MTGQTYNRLPRMLRELEKETIASGFTMASDRQTGTLLRTLAASKPAGRILELGTGTGLSASWLATGMDSRSSLITIDNDANCSGIAQKHLGADPRITILCTDAGNWLEAYDGPPFDIIFADTWAGKYRGLDFALNIVRNGGLYLADDMEEQPHWSPEHKADARNLVQILYRRRDYFTTRLDWASGIVIAVRIAGG